MLGYVLGGPLDSLFHILHGNHYLHTFGLFSEERYPKWMMYGCNLLLQVDFNFILVTMKIAIFRKTNKPGIIDSYQCIAN